jgi:hypothetical protein
MRAGNGDGVAAGRADGHGSGMRAGRRRHELELVCFHAAIGSVIRHRLRRAEPIGAERCDPIGPEPGGAQRDGHIASRCDDQAILERGCEAARKIGPAPGRNRDRRFAVAAGECDRDQTFLRAFAHVAFEVRVAALGIEPIAVGIRFGERRARARRIAERNVHVGEIERRVGDDGIRALGGLGSGGGA